MKKIFVTYPVAPAGIEHLKSNGCDVAVNETAAFLSPADLVKHCQNVDAVITTVADRITPDIIKVAAGTGVKIFANFGVGFNHIDFDYAKSKDIFVTNTPDVVTDTTADIAILLMLAVCRRFRESERLIRTGGFLGWATLTNYGMDITGKTLGIVGLGRIGEAVARRAKAFGMNIIYTRRSATLSDVGTRVSFETLLRESDVVSIHTPLTSETTHLFSAKQFALMKQGSVLINTGRGALVKESDLVEALRAGKFFGVGLDVFEFEPKVTEALYGFENAVLMPHIGTATLETRNKMSMICAENVLACLAGKRPPNVVWAE
jgi:glyoxylate reductase